MTQDYPFGDLLRTESANALHGKKHTTEVRSVFGWTDITSTDGDSEPAVVPLASLAAHQATLARLPVPPVEHTAKLYLTTARALARTEEEYAHTVKCVGELLESGLAAELQQALIEWKDSDKKPSWLEPFWDDSYLYLRETVAINVNYFFGFEDDPVLDKNTQVGRAASLLSGALTFFTSMRKNTWAFDYERGTPLCMSQYERVFAASRIPCKNRDEIITYGPAPAAENPSAPSKTSRYEPRATNHIVVIHQNRFFRFDALRDGSILPIHAMEAVFAKILEMGRAGGSSNCPPIGVLTAGGRNDWAQARQNLIDASAANRENLECLQSAIMVVVLDSLEPVDHDELARLLLHGPGTNRWFDRHNLIVCPNGKAGINFEHSVGDGATTLRVADEMFKFAARHGSRAADVARADQCAIEIAEMKWVVPDSIREALVSTFSVFKQSILMNETSTLNFTRFGGNFIKESGFSPDAFVQVSMQLAYYKLFGRPGATYESASTRQFLHGRTETVRSCTPAAVKFCEGAMGPVLRGDQYAEQYDLMKQACNAHVDYMKVAKSGMGVDRHLFGLRMMLEKKLQSLSGSADKTLPSIFTDPLHKRTSHWSMSTSHCGSQSLSLFGFGPVVQDGFGIGYMIKTNSVSFTVTAKKTCALTNAAIFASLLESSLLQMRAIVLSNPELRGQPSNTLTFRHPTCTADFSYFNYDQEMLEEVFGY